MLPHWKDKLELIAGFADLQSVLVETGTYHGKTAHAMAKYFSHVHSFELSGSLYEIAEKNCRSIKNITLYNMDSVEGLKAVLWSISMSKVFWLDAHYCCAPHVARGEVDCPLLQELEEIFKHDNNKVILIDDFDYFGKSGFPTLEEIKRVVPPGYSVSVSALPYVLEILWTP